MALRLARAQTLVLLLSYCVAGARTGAGHAAGGDTRRRAGPKPAGARRALLQSDAATFQRPRSSRGTASPRIVGGTQVRPARQ